MTNSIEKADRAMKRRDIFERLAKKADERMTPVLSEAIDEIASRDAEVARLKTVPMRYRRMAFNAQLQNELARLEQENDQLRAQIAELVAALEWVRKVTLDFEMHDAIDFALDKVRKP